MTLAVTRGWGRWASRTPTASLAVAAVAVLAALVPDAARWLEYHREGLAAGELWRLLTGHLAHFCADHLLLDVAMLVVLGSTAERRDGGGLRATLLAAALVIPLVLWLALPALQIYRGLSGLDSAALGFLLAHATVTAWQRRRIAHLLLVLASGGLFSAKVAYESIHGVALFVGADQAGFEPVPLAHATGLLVGILVGLIRWWRPGPRPDRPDAHQAGRLAAEKRPTRPSGSRAGSGGLESRGKKGRGDPGSIRRPDRARGCEAAREFSRRAPGGHRWAPSRRPR